MTTKNYFKLFSSLFFSFFVFSSMLAQEIIAEKGSYGVDTKNKIIVWHQSNLDSLIIAQKSLTHIKFDSPFTIVNDSSKLSYSNAITLTNNTNEYDLYITKLPIIHISIDTTTLKRNKKLPGNFSYYNENKYIESTMGVRQRGNLSLSFPKKSYDIEFWDDAISKKPKNLKFKGLRNDDDWILDALYNEPLKLRAYISTKIWYDIHKPYYLSKEPKAENGFEVKFVELFRNKEYRGLYALSESIDRKQLKLKKNKGNVVFGELFNASSYKDGGPLFKKVGAFNNLFPHYVGFRMEYPVIDYNSYWDNLSKLLDLVVNQPDEIFRDSIGKTFDISNAIDYYIFVNTLGAMDNLGNNYYLAKYDQNEPYFFVTWDLDGTFGVMREGQRIGFINSLLSTGLFDRLLEVNPDEFKTKLKLRWKILRETSISNKKIIKRFEKHYNKLTDQKIYEREQRIWPKKNSNKDDYEYLINWINNRLSYLDTQFESL